MPRAGRRWVVSLATGSEGEADILAVIIEYQLKPGVDAAFETALQAMLDLVRGFDGYLGEQPCRASDDPEHRVTISYWRDADALKAWRADPEHVRIQVLGRTEWLAWYRVRVLTLEREYGGGQTPATVASLGAG